MDGEARRETVRQAYSGLADLYIELLGATDKVPAEDLDLIERHLTLHDGPVLDLGCGPGHLTAHLRARGVDARGLDLVPEFVTHARATHGDHYTLGNLERLEAADGSIAGILAYYSLIHLEPERLGGVLEEFRRVLAPGAPLVIGFFEGDDVAAFEHKVVTAYRQPADGLARRLAEAGFAEVERLRRPQEGTDRVHATIAAR